MSATQTSFTIRLPKSLHKAARMKSVETAKSLNSVIVSKIAEWLSEDETTPKTKRAPKQVTTATVRASN